MFQDVPTRGQPEVRSMTGPGSRGFPHGEIDAWKETKQPSAGKAAHTRTTLSRRASGWCGQTPATKSVTINKKGEKDGILT